MTETLKADLPAECLDCYEILRAHVINASPNQGQGWVLFIRYGMLSWCQMDLALPCVPRSLPADVTMPTETMPGGGAQSAIQVLAGIVLHLYQEAAYGQ